MENIFGHVTCLKTQALSVCYDVSHPLHHLKQEIQDNLTSLAEQLQTSFEEIDYTSKEDYKNTREIDYSWSGAASLEHFVQDTNKRNQKILSALKNHASFVLCDTTLIIPEEITHASHIIKNELIIGRLFDKTEECCDSLKADSELQVVLKSLLALFSSSDECEQGHELQSSVDKMVDTTDPEIPTWTNSSQVAHLAKRKRPLKSETNPEESFTSNKSQIVCNCPTLCQRYLSKDALLDCQQLAFSKLVQRETLEISKIGSTVVMVTGLLSPENLKKSGIDKNKHGWLIKVDLGAVAMVRYQISDIRLLWSSCAKIERRNTLTSKVCVQCFLK